MKINKKTWYFVLLAVLLLVIWAIWRHSAEGPVTSNAPDKNNAGNTAQNQIIGNVWQGTLKVSNAPKKGNLMLVMDKTTVYINTSRDYSDLIGQRVNVSYQGTLDSFQLGDIVAQK